MLYKSVRAEFFWWCRQTGFSGLGRFQPYLLTISLQRLQDCNIRLVSCSRWNVTREIKSLNRSRNLRHSFSYSNRSYFILIIFIKRISNARVFLHAQLQLSVQALANVFVVFIRDVYRVATPDFPKILLGVTYNTCSMNSAAVNTTSPPILSVSQLSLVNRYHPAVLWARNPGGLV